MNSKKLASISAIALLLNSQQPDAFAGAVSLHQSTEASLLATPAQGAANKTVEATPVKKESTQKKEEKVQNKDTKPVAVTEKKDAPKVAATPVVKAAPAPKPEPEEPAYMKKYRLEQTVGTPEWKARQEELAAQAKKENEEKQKKEEEAKAQKVAAERSRNGDSDDNEYDSDKIADYSKGLYSEKKMSSSKKQDNDYEIVTDGLDDDDEKQTQEAKVSVV